MGFKNINSKNMKENNKFLILSKIRKGDYSRAELARETGLTRAGVSIIVDDLIKRGLVLEGEKCGKKLGRKAIRLEINPQAYYAIGLNISRHSLSIGISDLCGNIGETFYHDFEGCYDNVMALIDSKINEYISLIDRDKILGCGITVPGPISSQSLFSQIAPDFEIITNSDIYNIFNEKYKINFCIQNNSKAIALAEKNAGDRNLNNFIELIVDYSGIGAGIIIDGKLFEGAFGFGSEAGHISVDIDGEKCKCGNYGCAELYASIKNIVKYAKGLNSELSGWNIIVDRAEKGDKQCLEIIGREIKYLSFVIVNSINLFDVGTVILYGDIAYKADLFIGDLIKKVNEMIITGKINKVEIKISRLKEHAPILSSANIVFDKFFNGNLYMD